MSAYNYDADTCLQVLHRITEEIPLGVSGHELKVIYPNIKFTQELLSYIRNTIINPIKNVMEKLWTDFQISTKLKYLQELSEKQPDLQAWRPQTGNADLNPIIAQCLNDRKMELRKEIESIKEEAEIILPYIKQFSMQLEQQLEEMKHIEENGFKALVQSYIRQNNIQHTK